MRIATPRHITAVADYQPFWDRFPNHRFIYYSVYAPAFPVVHDLSIVTSYFTCFNSVCGNE